MLNVAYIQIEQPIKIIQH